MDALQLSADIAKRNQKALQSDFCVDTLFIVGKDGETRNFRGQGSAFATQSVKFQHILYGAMSGEESANDSCGSCHFSSPVCVKSNKK